MNEWRPKNWNEIKQQHPYCTIDYKATDIFEAGADAMLKAMQDDIEWPEAGA